MQGGLAPPVGGVGSAQAGRVDRRQVLIQRLLKGAAVLALENSRHLHGVEPRVVSVEPPILLCYEKSMSGAWRTSVM